MGQKKLAVIQDIAGFGRCSLTVALPVISAMKVQCCPVITSILSNHTGFSHCYFDDYTEKMPNYIQHWKQLNLQFDGIYSGYLGSKKQLDIVIDFFQYFSNNNPWIIVDPIMGDNGKIYKNFDDEMCRGMRQLISYANVITPNITECCILTNTVYKEKWTAKELAKMAKELHKLGPEKIVITGIHQGHYIGNFLSEKVSQNDQKNDKKVDTNCKKQILTEDGNNDIVAQKLIKSRHVGIDRPGTGDIFTSILAAGTVNGEPLEKEIRKASKFIQKCILRSEELHIPKEEGVCLEEFLVSL